MFVEQNPRSICPGVVTRNKPIKSSFPHQFSGENRGVQNSHLLITKHQPEHFWPKAYIILVGGHNQQVVFSFDRPAFRGGNFFPVKRTTPRVAPVGLFSPPKNGAATLVWTIKVQTKCKLKRTTRSKSAEYSWFHQLEKQLQICFCCWMIIDIDSCSGVPCMRFFFFFDGIYCSSLHEQPQTHGKTGSLGHKNRDKH